MILPHLSPIMPVAVLYAIKLATLFTLGAFVLNVARVVRPISLDLDLFRDT